MVFNGFSWIFDGFHNFLWLLLVSIAVLQVPLVSGNFHGLVAMVIYCFSLVFIDFHWFPLAFTGFICFSTSSSTISLSPLEYLVSSGVYWSLVVEYGGEAYGRDCLIYKPPLLPAPV